MARDSSYSLLCDNGATSASGIDFTSNPLASSQTQISFVCQHHRTATVSLGIGLNYTGKNGDILFRDQSGTLQFYVYSGGSLYGPATVGTTTLNGWNWKGFRFDASLSAGNRLAAFLDGSKGTDATGPTSQDGATGSTGFGYHGSTSQKGWAGHLRNAFLWVGKALPDSAFAAINAGVHPLVFGPTHWWPMDNTLVDLVGNNPLTNMGANISHSTAQSTPLITLPSGIIVPHRVAGAAPTFQAAWARNANILIGCSQ